MNFTTNPLRPAMTSPTCFSSQNTDSSQDCSWMFKNLTKWRISAHEGSCKPHDLEDRDMRKFKYMGGDRRRMKGRKE